MAAGTIADRSKAGTGANKVIVESGTRRRIDRIYGGPPGECDCGKYHEQRDN
jgi:hypothetical protein